MAKRIIILLFLISGQLYVQGQSSWTKRARIPAYRDRATAFSIGNYGYVLTGVGPSKALNDIWRYDSSTDTWMEMDSMPTSGRFNAFSFTIKNKGYIGAGISDELVCKTDFWEFDPELSKWTRKADYPKSNFCSREALHAFSGGEFGYLLLSFDNPNFYKYDPTEDKWTVLENFPILFHYDMVEFSVDEKGYVGLGHFQHDYSKEFWRYDPPENKWSRLADFPGIPRVGAVGFSIGTNGYIGLGSSLGIDHSDFWEYHPDSDSWSQVDSCPYLALYPVSFSLGSKGYVGTGVSFTQGTNFWEFNPMSSSISDYNFNNGIKIFPNPANNSIILDVDIQQITAICIFNSCGQKVLTINPSDKIIDVSELKIGIYFLVVWTDDGRFIQKIIKE